MKLASASEVAAAMLRFCEEAAYPSRDGPPEGWPRTAEPCYTFMYSGKRVLRTDVAEFLEALEGPVLLCPTLTSGVVLLTRLTDLTGPELAGARRGFEHQKAMYESLSEGVQPLKDDDHILLEFDDESTVFTGGTLRELSERFSINHVGRSLSSLKDNPHAKFSWDLWRPDGHTSKYCRQDI